jgi:hypothetical protein
MTSPSYCSGATYRELAPIRWCARQFGDAVPSVYCRVTGTQTTRGRLPVTAKLSRKFYDQFGDEIANELVDWFNKVDDTYRTELRELNELNYARFDAKLDQRLAEFAASLRAELAAVDAALRAEMASMKVELHKAIADSKSDLMRWMFALWATQMVVLIGVILAILQRGP